MSRLLAGVCLCLAFGVTAVEAAIVTGFSRDFSSRLWEARIIGQPGDPPEFQSICVDMVGAPPEFRLFVAGGVSRCGGAEFGGTRVWVLAPAGFSGPVNITVIITLGTSTEFTRFIVDTIAPPPPPPPPPPSRTLRLRAAAWDGSAFGAFEPAAGAPLTATARIPLGGVVIFQAIDSDGVVVPAEFTFGTPTLAEGVDSTALFAGEILHRYVSPDADQLHVQGVHLGLMTVNVTPSDPSLTSGTIAVEVGAPASLGAPADQLLDADVTSTAHRTGVPPDFIRAHVDKESRGNRMAYRYEPIGRTYGDLFYASRGRNARTQEPFTFHRLATQADTQDQALPEGELLINADIDPRATLRIGCDQNGVGGTEIGAGNPLNSLAWEIFRCNDATNPRRQRWSAAAGRFAAARIAALQADPFTAQTTLAASYGLLQVMYPVAIENDWVTNDGRQNPNLLFDRTGGVDRGEGSLLVGSRIVRDLIADYLIRSGITFNTRSTLVLLFNDTWQRYNRGEQGYGADVAARVLTFRPMLNGPIIQP